MKQKVKFKQTELGMIPKDWEVVRINDVLDKIIDYRGKTPKKSSYGIATLSAKSIKDGRIDYTKTYFISKETFEEWESRGKPKIGDVLLTTEAPIGQVAQLDRQNVAIAQRLLTLRGKEAQLDNSFLKYFLMSPIGQHELLSRGTGTTVQGIKQSEFRKILIVKPPINEQITISKILFELDAKIVVNQNMNKILNEIGRAIYKSWFVDFDGVKEFEDSELGLIPKGWKVEKLENFLELKKGVSYKSKELMPSNKALVTLKSVNRGGGYTERGLKSFNGKYNDDQIVYENDIIIAQTDLTQNADVIGKPALIRNSKVFDVLIASLDLVIVRAKNNEIPKSFLYNLFLRKEFQNHVFGYTSGTTVLHLHNRAIPDFKFILPPKKSLKKFNDIVLTMLQQNQKNSFMFQNQTKIRDSLLPKLVSGEIRV